MINKKLVSLVWLLLTSQLSSITGNEVRSLQRMRGDFDELLSSAGLSENTKELLVANGFDTIQSLMVMKASDIESIGIKLLGQKRILEQLLTYLKEDNNSLRNAISSEPHEAQQNDEQQNDIKEDYKHEYPKTMPESENYDSEPVRDPQDDESFEESFLDPDQSQSDWISWVKENKCTLIGAGVGLVAAPVVAPGAIAAAGFGKAGIVAGSLAAKAMSMAAAYGGGGVVASGTIATLQSLGAAGMGAMTTAATSTIGAAVGAVFGKSTCTESSGRKCSEKTSNKDP